MRYSASCVAQLVSDTDGRYLPHLLLSSIIICHWKAELYQPFKSSLWRATYSNILFSQHFIKLKNCVKKWLHSSLGKINPETKRCLNLCLSPIFTGSHLRLSLFVPEDRDERSGWFDQVVLDPTCNDLIKHPLCSWADKHHNKSHFLPLHFSPSDSSDRSSPSLWSCCPRLHGEIKAGKNIYIKDYMCEL